MPNGSASGALEPATAMIAAPQMDTSDHRRKDQPGRSPNSGIAATPTSTGASVFIRVTSATEVAFTALKKSSWCPA